MAMRTLALENVGAVCPVFYTATQFVAAKDVDILPVVRTMQAGSADDQLVIAIAVAGLSRFACASMGH